MISAFPVRFPLGVVGGLLVGLGVGLGAAWWTVNQWPDDQRFYWKTYYKATMDSAAEKFGRPPAPRAYLVLAGGKAGVVRLSPGKFQGYLQKNIYEGKTWLETVKVPGLWLLGCVFVAAGIGKRFDVLRQRGARWGEHVRGTSLVSWRQANREALSSGVTRGISIPVGWWSWQKITIPLDLEAYHFGICSSTGMGKTTLIRWILRQVEERGESAIIYDPKGEYRDEFYSQDRRDVILDPTDDRCPYWAMEEEAEDEATATPWAKAFFPDEPRDQPYFKKHPREIISFLMNRYSTWNEKQEPCTCENLAKWVANPAVELTKRLKGTTYAVDINPAAKNQSQGLLSTVGEIAKPLRMMPPKEEGRPVFSVRDYAKKRRGWIFMTSTPETVDALLPLQSAIMDMLILKTQAYRQGARKVWFVMDELATMQRLPQLESAMTKQRASGNPVIIGYHDMGQLRERYGNNVASTTVSQPFSNFCMRTGDGEAAKHVELQIGHEEVERISENRSAHLLGHRRGRSWNSQTADRPVVMAAEIQGLPRFQGYFWLGGRVVKIKIQKLARKIRTRRIERLIPPLVIPDGPEDLQPEGKPVPVDDMPPSWPEGMPVEVSASGFGDPYMLALAVNAKRIAQADKRDGMTQDDYEGPPVTRFICGKCKTIVDFDGVLEEPGSLCPKCHGKFYSRAEGYVRNTIMEPHRKSGKSSIPKKPMASLHADKRQDENPILAILGKRREP